MNRKSRVVPLSFGIIFLVLVLTSCGSKVFVTISPTTVTMKSGEKQQFYADVTGSSNQAVRWAVNGIIGGAPQDGMISTSGMYTAPATKASKEVAVSAAPIANPKRAAISLVTVIGTSLEPQPEGTAPPLPR